MDKPIIYQMLPRLWGNSSTDLRKGGSLEENGTGKLSDIDIRTLEYIRWLGCTHVWYTGIIRHSTKSASSGNAASHPQFVKGEAGSPYAITDYHDINPYLADDPDNRMEEFDALVKRTHDAGLKVILDFVPNHVARDYGRFSSSGNPGVVLGEGDDTSRHWSESNDFFYYPGQALQLPNTAEFNSECNDIRKGNFHRDFHILPAWFVNGCSVKYRETTVEEYNAFLAKYGGLLTPYREFPAKATGNCYTASPGVNDWYETVKINYCDTHSGTWDKMLGILEYWIDRGVDGFRCDMAELVPSDFFRWAIAAVKKRHPEIIFVAEVYKKDLYRKYIREVGFDYLYDKSGIYDTLRAITDKNINDNGMPIELWQSARGITRNWQFLGDLQPYMLNFLENHDEQRFASDFFGKDGKNTFATLYVALFLNRAAFMIYAGEEAGERGMDEEGFSGRDGRTTIFDWWSVPALRKIRKMISSGEYMEDTGKGTPQQEIFHRFSRAIRFAATDDAVRKGMTYDLCYCNYDSDGFDKDRHFAFLRDCGEETIMVVANFSTRHADMKLRIPAHAFEWLELDVSEELNPESLIEVSVNAMDAVVIQLSPERKILL